MLTNAVLRESLRMTTRCDTENQHASAIDRAYFSPIRSLLIWKFPETVMVSLHSPSLLASLGVFSENSPPLLLSVLANVNSGRQVDLSVFPRLEISLISPTVSFPKMPK